MANNDRERGRTGKPSSTSIRGKVNSDTGKEFREADAFLLGYLPHRVGAHLQTLETLLHARSGAAGELASRVEARLHSLPERGPEVVSCVRQLETILGERRLCFKNCFSAIILPSLSLYVRLISNP